MSGKYDPRAPRRNTEFNDILKAMRQKWRDLNAAGTYNEIRGHALVMLALIEQLLEEPEFVYDLSPGPVINGRALYEAAEETGAPAFLNEGPFDRPGHDEGRFFYYTYSGRITPLFVKPGDPYFPFTMSGYWVYRLEKRYAGQLETQMHLTSEEAFHRICPRRRKPKFEENRQYYILMDPKGIYSGNSARLVAVHTSLKRAIKAADRLTQWLQIRFLAASLVERIHTH